MARQARKYSDSEYMHVMVRGIGRQMLFEERSDYLYYLWLLEKYTRGMNVSVCAYCLMDNHVHLLVHDPAGEISVFMKKLGVSYSYYFNKKYERIGHLFQDRYQSESIDRDEYLFTVFRYILNNPKKAGIAEASQYEWSSFRLFGNDESFVDTSLFVDRFGTKENYIEFIEQGENDNCMDVGSVRITDTRAKEIIKIVLGSESGTILQSLAREKRDAAIEELLKCGLSIRQIERLTGISRGIIQKVIW